MAVLTNTETGLPADWAPGCDFFQMDDDEFSVVSEPNGLVAVVTRNSQGYITLDAAKRMYAALGLAIANSGANLTTES